MNSNLKGNIGEVEAIKYFTREGYEVYLPFGTATQCDLVVVKENITYRVSVKTTSSKRPSGNYRVRIRKGRMNSQVPFNPQESDLLFVYILPEDRSYVFNSKEVKTQFEITVK